MYKYTTALVEPQKHPKKEAIGQTVPWFGNNFQYYMRGGNSSPNYLPTVIFSSQIAYHEVISSNADNMQGFCKSVLAEARKDKRFAYECPQR